MVSSILLSPYVLIVVTQDLQLQLVYFVFLVWNKNVREKETFGRYTVVQCVPRDTPSSEGQQFAQ